MGNTRIVLASAATASLLMVRLSDNQYTIGSYISVFSAIIALEVFCLLLWKHALYPFFFSPLRKLPGPKGGSWIMGHGPTLISSPTLVPLVKWMEEIPNDGLLRYLTFFNLERITVTSVQAVAEITVNKSYEFQKPSMMRNTLIQLLGNGLVVAENDAHRFQRRNLQPAFTFRHVKELYPMFWHHSCALADSLMQIKSETSNSDAGERGRSGEVEVEISGWLSRSMQDIVGQAACGLEFGALQDPDNELSRSYNSILKYSTSARFMAILGFLFPSALLQSIPTRTNRTVRQGRAAFRRECIRLIQTKKQLIANKESSGIDILSVAMQSGAFTDEGLTDQLMTFLFAGHETTSNAAGWALYLCACYPEVQRRLREEIRAHMPSPSTPEGRAAVDHKVIDSMPYLRAFCSEVLRFTPPVSATFREVAGHNTTLLGTHLPKGTVIVIAPAALQKNKDLWGPDAGAFKPERWLGEKNVGSGGATNHLAFSTFLHGPRSCIGQGFSKGVFACVIASLVGSFEWDMKDPALKDMTTMLGTMKTGITTRFNNGLFMKIKYVEGW